MRFIHGKGIIALAAFEQIVKDKQLVKFTK